MRLERDKLENVAIRMVKAPPLSGSERIRTAKDVARVLGKELQNYDREVVCVVNFRSNGSPINMNIVSMGTINASPASAREAFKSTILSNAANIMPVHNHPGDGMEPSGGDIRLTDTMRMAAEIMDIPLPDHVIIGRDGKYFSFRESGLLRAPENKNLHAAEEKKSILGELGRRAGELCQRQEKGTVQNTRPADRER